MTRAVRPTALAGGNACNACSAPQPAETPISPQTWRTRTSPIRCRPICPFPARCIATTRTAQDSPSPTVPASGCHVRTTPRAASIRPGSLPRLAGFLWPEQLPRIRQEALPAGENGGIHGHVVYASTRPFDDPQLLLQTSWEPLVPHVTINLYQEGLACRRRDPDTHAGGSHRDHAVSTIGRRASGRRRTDPEHELPGPGQQTPIACRIRTSFTLKDQPQWLDLYNNRRHACTLPCRTTPSSSATTACTTGTSCSLLLMTACTVPERHRHRTRRPASRTRHELHRLHYQPGHQPILSQRHAHAAGRQVRGRSGSSAGL